MLMRIHKDRAVNLERLSDLVDCGCEFDLSDSITFSIRRAVTGYLDESVIEFRFWVDLESNWGVRVLISGFLRRASVKAIEAIR